MRAPPILLLLCTLGSLSPAALAGDLPVQTAEATAMTDKSRQLFQEGVVAYNKGKLLEAHASFLAAWSLHPHWQIAGNLADIESDLHKYREAAEHAAYYAKHAPADRHDKAEAMVKRAVAQVGTLAIEVDAAGADVLVDGALAGRAPLAEAVFVDPGEHKVTVRFPGRPDAVQAVTLAAGGSQAVSIKVLPKEAPVVPRVPAGPNKTIVIVGAAVTGVGVVTGVVLAVLANGKGSDADAALAPISASGSTNPCATNAGACTTIHNDRLTHDTLAKGAVGAFAGAGAIGVATVGYALLAPSLSKSTGAKLMPTVGSNGAGMALVGAW